MPEFICYERCTTCQKARKWLEEKGVACTVRDIKTQNPGRDELALWYEKSGLPIKRFLNTSGLQYKALGLKDKLPSMSDGEILDLLATDGMLVKRPILVLPDNILVGFKLPEWEAVLGE